MVNKKTTFTIYRITIVKTIVLLTKNSDKLKYVYN